MDKNIVIMNNNPPSPFGQTEIGDRSDCQKVYIDNMSIYYLYKNGGIKNMNVRCQRCAHEWDYTGNNPYRTVCPYCQTSVRVKLGHQRYLDAHYEGDSE